VRVTVTYKGTGLCQWCLAALLMAPTTVGARPPHKQAIVQHFGELLPAKLNACTLCHLSEKSSTEEKPHNAFGKRLKAMGKDQDIVRRFEKIAEEDSDGDGFPNILELLAGRAPGNALDKPTDDELVAARRTLTDYRRLTSAYAWRPFEPVKRPAPPTTENDAWCRNAIDRFVAAEREAHGLKPQPEAAKTTLLRRLYFDLIGLAPTPEEIDAFVNDPTLAAYDKVVDRLLAGARYGERWGRHWMDVWRYSDWAGWTDGGQIRDSQPHIWRWRDWIIDSLNEDKGYDRMVLEMFAADELTPTDESALRATGYLARNYKMLSREKWLQDTVDHTFLAFQGLTLGCARCHDHMYDPIGQNEYYQVRAIFTPHQVRLDRVPGQSDLKKDGLARVYDADLNAATYLLIRGDDRTPDKTPLAPGVPVVLAGKYNPVSVPLPLEAQMPDKREFVRREARFAVEMEFNQSTERFEKAAYQFEKASVPPRNGGFFADSMHREQLRLLSGKLQLIQAEHKSVREKRNALIAVLAVEKLEDQGKKATPEWKSAAENAVVQQRRAAVLEAKRLLMLAQEERARAPAAQIAAADKKFEAAQKTLTQAEAEEKKPVTTQYTPRVSKVYPSSSSGRRLAFARWLAVNENPLTARVAVNHIWLRHFGQALVPSVFDFGRNGRLPSHPALLDWLAAEFMQPTSGAKPWSMKHLHRLIVTSAAYRMASTPDATALERDPDNRWLWRMPPRRLEAEIVRDNVLHVAGKLDLTMSGPDIDHQQGQSVLRRSVYFRHAAEKQMEFLKLFDAASVTECYQRKESIIPQQALALANSELSIRMARLVARDLAAKNGVDVAGFIAAAFRRVLSRSPMPDEVTECACFVLQQTALHSEKQTKPTATDAEGRIPSHDPAIRARENLVQVLLNHHEFVTVR